ncbi:MAG TPA: phosphatase PAP2 family protein [Thermoanaerobaculia bacterium]
MLRRFVWLLAILVVLFVVTEIAGAMGWVAHLQPVSFHGLLANPLFAIGFGGPLLLHLSSLPRWKELAITALLGIGLSLLVGQWVLGLGLASTVVLLVKSIRDAEARLFLLPALITLFFTLEVAMFLGVVSHIAPLTYDGIAFAGDAAFGANISFEVGRLFAAVPFIAAVCTAIYLAPPPGLIFVYALQVRGKQRPPVDIVTTLVVMGITGYALYFLFPVCGPKFAFPSFPNNPPDAARLAGNLLPVPPAPRNGVPSLHMASALIAWIHARRYGRIAGAVAMVFVIGTFLATMGTGEHYFIDLAVAVPFTFAMEFLLQRRLREAIAPAMLFFVWLLTLRFYGQVSVAMWGLLLVTIAHAAYALWRVDRHGGEDHVGVLPLRIQ